MSQSTARAPTAFASRYLQQLCKHWAHKFQVTHDPAAGHIDFGGPTCALAADDQGLTVRITAPADELDRWERVVAVHVNRFAHKEGELPFDWTRS